MSAPEFGTYQTVGAVLDGYGRMIRELSRDLALRLVWDDLGVDTSGCYNGPDRLVTINRTAPLDVQYWFVHQVWTLCMFGECAVPAAKRGPHLRVID